MSRRRQHPAEFKGKVAPESLMGEETAAEPARRCRVHLTIIHPWKRALLEGASGVFGRGGRKQADGDDQTGALMAFAEWVGPCFRATIRPFGRIKPKDQTKWFDKRRF